MRSGICAQICQSLARRWIFFRKHILSSAKTFVSLHFWSFLFILYLISIKINRYIYYTFRYIQILSWDIYNISRWRRQKSEYNHGNEMISSLLEFSLDSSSVVQINWIAYFIFYLFFSTRINSKSIYCQFNCIIWFNGNWVKKKVNDSALSIFHEIFSLFFFCNSIHMNKVLPYFFLYVSICDKLHRKVKFLQLHDTHTKWFPKESIYTYDPYHGSIWKTKQRMKERRKKGKFNFVHHDRKMIKFVSKIVLCCLYHELHT